MSRRAFSLIDMLVSLAIVALLMGILLPSLGRVREIARQAVCASNDRQIGLGIHMFADENKSFLPSSLFLDPESPYSGGRSADIQQRRMILLRFRTITHVGQGRESAAPWDGLGKLFADQYLPASAVFYCPSHRGSHPLDRYADRFVLAGSNEIYSNYQYRGQGPDGQRRLHMLDSGVALVADALAGEEYFNHAEGFNVLSVDGSVSWFADAGGSLATRLADTETATDDNSVGLTWGRFDGQGLGAP